MKQHRAGEKRFGFSCIDYPLAGYQIEIMLYGSHPTGGARHKSAPGLARQVIIPVKKTEADEVTQAGIELYPPKNTR